MLYLVYPIAASLALFRSEDDPPAAKPATPLLSLRWTFRAKRACVVITDAEPDRLAPLTPPAPIGLARAERLLKIPAEPAPSCVSPALQLKREWSPWPEFGWIPANLCDLSKG